MGKLQDLFGSHKKALIEDIKTEVENHGNKLEVGAVIEQMGRSVVIDQLRLAPIMFEEAEGMQVHALSTDKHIPSEKFAKPLKEYSMDVIYSICVAIDKRGGSR